MRIQEQNSETDILSQYAFVHLEKMQDISIFLS